ncbi:MAG: hypothetical protein HOC09_33855 [Deltaproteobacteria bacterium]|jgi:ABC-type transporter Mla MlaB component|nr:hypothetical protein [Deltaproteobacteria bacterium]
MIFIKETFSEDGGVSIQIEGQLDSDSIPSLRDMCADHLSHERVIRLNLEKVDRIDRESLDYLRSVQTQVCLEGLNQYIRLELNDADSPNVSER